MPATVVSISDTLDTLMSLTFPGVKTMMRYPPMSVSSAQLPLLYVRNCQFSIDQRSLNFQGGLRTIGAEIVVIVDVSRQNTTEELYSKTRTMMDSVANVIDQNAAALRLDDYLIKEDFEAVDTNSYFVISAVIRCA
jgi:hypothetical protein